MEEKISQGKNPALDKKKHNDYLETLYYTIDITSSQLTLKIKILTILKMHRFQRMLYQDE